MSQPINRASTLQPFPCFYVYRPGYMVVPLIPLDELPGWIQVGDFNWADSALYESMLPASFNCFPRVGEYDVVCHHCYAHVDSFHRSVSERSNSNASSRASNVPKGLAAAGPSKKAVLDRPCMLNHPPFEASFNTSPFVGMCFLKCPWWPTRSRSTSPDAPIVNQDPQDNHGSNHSDQSQQEQAARGVDPQAEESRSEEHERNAEAETPIPIEKTMPFPMGIDNNNHNAVAGDSIADPRHETEVQSHAVNPQSRTQMQSSAVFSSYPGDAPLALHRPSSPESRQCDRPRSRPRELRPNRRHVRFAWPAGGLQPVVRRTGSIARVVER